MSSEIRREKRNRKWRPLKVDLRPDLAEYVERIAEAVVGMSGLGPGSSAIAIARALDTKVEWDARLPGFALGMCLPPGDLGGVGGLIILATDRSRLDDEQTTGHELTHLWANDLRKLRAEDGGHEQEEEACDRGSDAFLMPRTAFVAAARELRCDHRALACRFPHAMSSAIRRRLSQLHHLITTTAQEAA